MFTKIKEVLATPSMEELTIPKQYERVYDHFIQGILEGKDIMVVVSDDHRHNMMISGESDRTPKQIISDLYGHFYALQFDEVKPN